MARSTLLAALATAALVPTVLSAQTDAVAGRWSANIRPTLSSSSGIGSSTKRIYGSVNITPSATGSRGAWQVEIHLTSDQNNEMLLWTVASGKCMSGAIPLVQPNELAPLEVRSNGVADLTANAALRLNTNEAYHLDVFRNGQQQEHVIACTSLKYTAPK